MRLSIELNGYYPVRLGGYLQVYSLQKVRCNLSKYNSVYFEVRDGSFTWSYSSRLPNRTTSQMHYLLGTLDKQSHYIEVVSPPQPSYKDILYTKQQACLRTLGTIVKPSKSFNYSGEGFLTRNYGRIVRVLGNHVLVKWEHTLQNESYLGDYKHWIVPISRLVGVKHRDVTHDFQDTLTTIKLLPTTDKFGVIGKTYYTQHNKEVVAIDSDDCPYFVEPAPSYKMLQAYYMSELFERTTVTVDAPPSATIAE